MKSKKTTAIVFAAIGLLLSHGMCIHVAFAYCDLLWRIAEMGFSAPASLAFLLMIPYVLGIAAAFIIACILWKKAKKEG